MLWEKESSRKNALYKNICADLDTLKIRNTLSKQFQSLRKNHSPKNNKSSVDHRNEGNKKFADKNWLEAIESYNKSLSFAENKSPNVGLAYANRSACFYKLELYEKCLIDIQFAKKSNYPKNLMGKLDERKENCMKYMKSAEKPAFVEPKLSFEADKNIACMANSVQLKFDNKFGRHFIATHDIGVGDIIFRDEFFISMVPHDSYKRCSVCSTEYDNLYPCARCTNALFCSGKCEKNGMHKRECGLAAHDSKDTEDDMQNNTIRSILIATNMFQSVEELVKFVEEAIGTELNEISSDIPKMLTDAKSKYRAFLKLSFDKKAKQAEINVRTYLDYNSLVSNYGLGTVFETKKHRRFLMHLIGHHIRILDRNSQNLISTTSDEKNFYVSILAGYLNHSCAPNVMVNFKLISIIKKISNFYNLFIFCFVY